MDARDVLREAASRPAAEAKALIDTLPEGALNAHAGGHTNSIAWLLWHAGRQMDAQLSQLNGEPQVWHCQGFDSRAARQTAALCLAALPVRPRNHVESNRGAWTIPVRI